MNKSAKQKHVVIRENTSRNCIYDSDEYYILPEKTYDEEVESGLWNHYTYESVIVFENKRKAEKYVRSIENKSFVVVRDDDDGETFIDNTAYNGNIAANPSIYTILYKGTEGDCNRYLKGLK